MSEDKILQHIKHQHLFEEKDKFLLAVSGGLDSMTMMHLFQQLNYNFSVAHCNFKLRGNESDEDEKFLENICASNNITFYSQAFNTRQYADESGISDVSPWTSLSMVRKPL